MVRIRAKTPLVPGLWGELEHAFDTDAKREAYVQSLLEAMTLDEKIDQLSGDTPLITGLIDMVQRYNERPLPAGENLRLGIPGIRFSDGPRGVVMDHSTCFPVAMARGASWDKDLEARIGDAIGVEARAQGANFFGGVCVNLLRHPAWGRAQETYGEAPYHLGEMGAALVRGVQRHIMACVKHFACNSIENARFKVDVQIDERTLREVYLPHFRRCVAEGAASVMSAYNQVNGQFCSHNPHLLRDILKDDWGFDGFVTSDFVFAVKDATAVADGLDIEMPFTLRFGRRLRRAVRRGDVPEAEIDEAVLRTLRQKVRFAAVGEPGRYRPEVVASAAHRALAREAAQKSMVLLKNQPLVTTEAPVLPLNPSALTALAVIGPLADAPNLGDEGSSQVRPPEVVTPLTGLQQAAEGRFTVTHLPGDDVAQAADAAREADIAIVVVGYTHEHEGEYIDEVFHRRGGDRATLTLPAADEALIQAVATANPRTVVVMIGGSAIITERWRAQVPTILMAWYQGMEGGHALADLLLGEVAPSGKLPCSFPRSADQLPFFDRDAKQITYGYFHGYWKLDQQGTRPAFPFGFGLSYTTFAYRDLVVETPEIDTEGTARVAVTITNTGSRPGDEIVQLYVGCEDSAVTRPVRALKAFQRVSLAPGEKHRVTFKLPASRLAYYDVEREGWRVEPQTYQIYVGASSDPRDLLNGTVRINPK
jgi:beta-glucosidase